MLALTFALLAAMFGVRGRMEVSGLPRVPLTRRGLAVVVIFGVTVAAWLSEPWHGVSAAVVALLCAALLFGSGLLDGGDLGRLDWSTLLLVAGGLTLGELLEVSGLTEAVAQAVPWQRMPETLLLLAFLLVGALLSAVASNTAAAVILIPIGLRIMPEPSFAVLVALAASMGVPFVISTPPNAMAYGQGGLRTRDLAVPGAMLMLAGCVLLALTGPTVLRWLGVP
jgi:sodium-dependent dicarboxylate transporter 2/3/5